MNAAGPLPRREGPLGRQRSTRSDKRGGHIQPVLLLIPGMFNTSAIWDPVTVHLQGQVELRCANVQTQDSIAAMAEDAWRQVSDVAAGTPLVVCGFSMGGYVAIELLAAHRDRIQAVALIDSAASIETPESTLVREKTIAALERNFERTVEGIIAFSLHPDNRSNTALVDGMRRMMHAVGAPTAIRQTRAITARADHRAMLAHLAIPTLVACGRADQVTPPALSQELALLVPGARLVWIEPAGHQTPLEQPAQLAQLLLALVREAMDRK